MKEYNYKVYMHVNKINNKKYIGITRQRPKERWRNGNGYYQNKHFYNAIQKYGWDNFEHYILHTGLTKQEAEDKERELIAYFDSANRNKGYNIELGGNAIGKLSKETKNKISKANKGKLKGGKNPSAKKVVCEGIEFESAKECAEYYNIQPTTMREWLNGQNKIPIEWYNKGLKYIDKQICDYIIKHDNSGEYHSRSKPVICEGKEFSNIRECAEYYGMNSKVMDNWLRKINKIPKEWYDKCLHYKGETMDNYIIQEKLCGEKNGTAKKVYCEGKLFNCAKYCSEYYNINYHTMMNWLNHSKPMPAKWYNMKLHYENEDMISYKVQTGILKGEKHPNSRKVLCENKEFCSTKECAEYYKINASTMGDWLNHKVKMNKKFYYMELHYKDEPMENYECSTKSKIVICDGQIFDSIKDCASHYEIKPYTMQRWLKGENRIPQKFIDLGLKIL